MPVAIDPRTLRPAIETQAEKEAEEEGRLRDKAANRLITDSPDGRKVIEIIRKRLYDRIEKVLTEDGECRGLLTVLQDLGAAERIANNAVDQLAKRYLKIAPKQGVM